MSTKPQLSFRSIRDQRPFKFAAWASLIFAFVVAAVAITLRMTNAIENIVFNILMAIGGLLLVESLILPKILGRVRGRKYEFFQDHMKYYISPERQFSIPYAQMRSVRAERIERTDRYKNIPVNDVFISIDTDKLDAFANTVIHKGELKLPAVPERENAASLITNILETYRGNQAALKTPPGPADPAV